MIRAVIELDENDLLRLVNLACLSTWLQERWREQFSEFNCDLLPCDVLTNILSQVDPKTELRLEALKEPSLVVYRDVKGNFYEVSP